MLTYRLGTVSIREDRNPRSGGLLPSIVDVLQIPIVEPLQVINVPRGIEIKPLLSWMKADPFVLGRCSVEAAHRPGAVVSRRVAREGIYGQLEVLGIIHLVFPVRVEKGPLGQRRANVFPEVPAADRLVKDE